MIDNSVCYIDLGPYSKLTFIPFWCGIEHKRAIQVCDEQDDMAMNIFYRSMCEEYDCTDPEDLDDDSEPCEYEDIV